MSDPGTISPTAHYTGQVWLRNDLSHPLLGTTEGRLLFESLEPAMRASRALGGPSLEPYLLARHQAIDARLAHAIERDQITQVLEVAAGMSPRGWRFAGRYGERLTYVEADLPAMAARKRRALERIGSLSDRHRVVDCDALRQGGPLSLETIADGLDHGAGLAVVTEGLLGYLAPDDVESLWRRLATELHGFSRGRYVSDVHLGSSQNAFVRGFRLALSAFVRGRVYLHFADAADAEAQLRACGFDAAAVRPAAELRADRSGAQLAHILEASTA